MVTPICVKVGVAIQKYRIPFKNMSDSQDAELEFQFVKNMPVRSTTTDESSVEETQKLDEMDNERNEILGCIEL